MAAPRQIQVGDYVNISFHYGDDELQTQFEIMKINHGEIYIGRVEDSPTDYQFKMVNRDGRFVIEGVENLVYNVNFTNRVIFTYPIDETRVYWLLKYYQGENNLQGARFPVINGLVFDGANLTDVTFNDIHDCTFRNCNLTDVEFIVTSIGNTTFENCTIKDWTFETVSGIATFRNNAIGSMNIHGDLVDEIHEDNLFEMIRHGGYPSEDIDPILGWRNVARFMDFPNQKMSGSEISNIDLSNLDMSGVDLSRSQISVVNFDDTDLSGAVLDEASFNEPLPDYAVTLELHLEEFKGCSFSQADLSYSSLRNANLSNCNLKRANLIGADLTGAILDNANLEGAQFQNTILDGVDFSKTRGTPKHIPLIKSSMKR